MEIICVPRVAFGVRWLGACIGRRKQRLAGGMWACCMYLQGLPCSCCWTCLVDGAGLCLWGRAVACSGVCRMGCWCMHGSGRGKVLRVRAGVRLHWLEQKMIAHVTRHGMWWEPMCYASGVRTGAAAWQC